MTIFKACDVRGIVGRDWDVDEARAIGGALGWMLRRRDQFGIIVGGDFRHSTPRLKEALVDGLLRNGITVHDVGQVPTPLVQYAARHLGCRNLAIVTASHNPGIYNGVKFVLDRRPPVPHVLRELQDACALEIPKCAPGGKHLHDIVEDYAAWVIPASRVFVADRLESVGAEAVGKDLSKRTVVVDTMGGAFTGLAPRILAAAGYEVISLDNELDREFVRRDPNPSVDENLQDVVTAVTTERADMGMAFDGDGDRVIFVDEHGTIARPEQIAAFFLRQFAGPCCIVHDLKCASLVADAAKKCGGTAIMQPSGHGFIKRKLLETNAELGVEVSGHHFFGVLDGGDDGLFTSLVMLQLLEQSGIQLGDWLAEIGWPAITPDLRIPFDGDSASTLDNLAATCGGKVNQMDGVRTEYEDNGWALARASITEPAMTFRFEGRDMRRVRRIATRFLTAEPELCHKVLEKIQ